MVSPDEKPSGYRPYKRYRAGKEANGHWVVAKRQGQTAALNMFGHREKFTAVPFVWSITTSRSIVWGMLKIATNS
jgi:hypothetical protein